MVLAAPRDHSRSSLGPRAARPQKRAQRARFLFALRAHCGRAARGPSEELECEPILRASIRVVKCRFTEFDHMRHQNTLDLTQSAFVIIDMQDAFRTKVAGFTEIAERIAVMVAGAKLLNLPIIVTEQYPKGLGHTVSEIKEALPESIEIIEKTTFSSCGVQAFADQLERAGAKQVLVCGIEAHVCVNQTVHDLLARGFQVHLLTGCILSRQPHDRRVALRKMQVSGAILSTVEMALFELMRDAKHEQFKAIQGLIK